MKFLAFSQTKILGSSFALPANGLGGSRATSFSVVHFTLQNTKFKGEKGKVQKPARIPPQTPPAGGFQNCFFFEIRRNRKIIDIDLFEILV